MCLFIRNTRSPTCLQNAQVILVGAIVGSVLAFLHITHAPIRQAPPMSPYKMSTVHFNTNKTVADHMRHEIRILCWIMTGPQNHLKKAQHIRHTWGRHCNTLLFMTSVEDPNLENTIPLAVEEGRDNLWPKTKEAFKYVHDHHRHDADWFLKADDDTYVIMENLRALLHPYSPELPIYFGRKFKIPHGPPKQGYMSGGGGYVLSKQALNMFVEKGIDNASMCIQENNHSEDLALGKCMANLGVLAGDSRDGYGFDRFFPLKMNFHLFPSWYGKFWYNNYTYYKTHDGRDAIPAGAVSFHYIAPRYLYLFDYAIYEIRNYGIAQLPMPIDELKFTVDDVKQSLALAEADYNVLH